MKKMILASVIFIGFISCNGNSTDNAGSDSVGLTNPVSIDTTKHPTGMDNSSVISSDTAAMNVSNSYEKLDSMKKQ